MADQQNGFGLRDALLAIPITGSAFAMAWEVGYFLPIGSAAFSFFSITEHLGFAVRALPLALVFASLILFVVMFRSADRRRVLARYLAGKRSERQGKRVRLTIRVALIIFFLIGGIALGAAIYVKSAAMFVYSLGMLFAGLVMSYDFTFCFRSDRYLR